MNALNLGFTGAQTYSVCSKVALGQRIYVNRRMGTASSAVVFDGIIVVAWQPRRRLTAMMMMTKKKALPNST